MKIVVSFGDPNGIGFETFYKSFFVSNEAFKSLEFTLVANTKTIEEYAQKNNFKIELGDNFIEINNHKIKIIEIDYVPIKFGQISKSSGEYSLNSLSVATKLVKEQKYDSLLTLPVSKYSLSLAGYEYPGQTEYFAQIDGSQDYLMILFNERMKVALATIHIPLKEVSNKITYDLLTNKLNTFYSSLINDFGIEYPKIAVLSLNPHAGEFGQIGTEEIETIIPAVNNFQEKLMGIYGPFPPDSFFRDQESLMYDGIFAMYHDQGLIPLKMNSKNGGVNFTAGLSFIRVSPDHGTGFSIAGHNRANPMSTYQAILWAEIIYQNRIKKQG